MKLWQLLRDIVLTGTAIFVVVTQVYSAHPSDILLATALALTAPSVAEHTRALLSGHGGGPSSPPEHARPAPRSPSSPEQEASGD